MINVVNPEFVDLAGVADSTGVTRVGVFLAEVAFK
jgi:hypothetical protein